jgi:uncharacterized membrane protein
MTLSSFAISRIVLCRFISVMVLNSLLSKAEEHRGSLYFQSFHFYHDIFEINVELYVR